MKQKKIVLVLMMVMLVTALSGCSKSSNFAIGTWNENVFENSWLNMTFEIPEDWTIATDEEISAVMGAGIDIVELQGTSKEALKAAAELQNIYGFMATSSSQTTNVQLVYENLALTVGGTKYTESEYMETLVEMLTEQESFGYEVVDQSTVELAGKTFEYMELTMGGGLYNQDFYCYKIDGFMVSIVFSYTPEEVSLKDDFIKNISTLK